jgi:hypothetical protein
LRTNTGYFTVTTGSGFVGFSKPFGSVSNIQYATLCSLLEAEGDFDARVDFTNANITNTGSPGNQIQLNTRFGGQDFLMVRSDDSFALQNAHVFPNPPGSFSMGVISWTTNFGTLRVVRTGTLVQGYIDSTLSYQNNYNTNDATFSFVLQNTGSSDPISVQFSNFRLTAGRIIPIQAMMNAGSPTNGMMTVSWKDTSWPDVLQGYRLQSAPTPAGPWNLSNNQGVLNSSNQFTTSFSVTGSNTFFRLLQGP